MQSILIAFILIGAGFLLGQSVRTPGQQVFSVKGEAKDVVHLVIDDDTGRLQTFPNEKFFSEQTVFDILKQTTDREHIPFVYDPPGEYGVFIRQIGEKKNGATKKYWQYLVNGQFAMVAADKFSIKTGDTVLWKFTGEQME